MKNKNYKIQYSSEFLSDIENILRYIMYNLQNKMAAKNLLNLVIQEIEKRSISPESYKSFKLRKNSHYTWYRINVKNYSIFYTVENNIMTVRRFIYSKRDINNIL